MSQYQLPTKEKKPEYVQSNFDGIARAYDRFNDWNTFFLHRVWKKKLAAKALALNPKASSALDLCCGTGDITAELSKISQLETVMGIDFSEKMLGIAKEKLKEKSHITLQVGDAMNLSAIPSNSQDIVTMGFGLRNVQNIDKCLKEIHRILRPGAVFLNLDIGKVRPRFLKPFADFYFFRIVPIIGYLVYGGKNQMFDYLPHSSLTYPDQETLVEVLGLASFREVEFQNFVFGNAVLHWARK